MLKYGGKDEGEGDFPFVGAEGPAYGPVVDLLPAFLTSVSIRFGTSFRILFFIPFIIQHSAFSISRCFLTSSYSFSSKSSTRPASGSVVGWPTSLVRRRRSIRGWRT